MISKFITILIGTQIVTNGLWFCSSYPTSSLVPVVVIAYLAVASFLVVAEAFYVMDNLDS